MYAFRSCTQHHITELRFCLIIMTIQDRASSSTSDLEEHLLQKEEDDFEPLSHRRPQPRRQWWKWGLHFIIFLFNAGLSIYLLKHIRATEPPAKQSAVLREHELPWAEDVVSYEEKTFVASGFHERDDAPNTVFEGFGEPSRDRDLAWLNLTSGMTHQSIIKAYLTINSGSGWSYKRTK